MLVLSRKSQESVIISPDLKVQVLEIRASHVRLGFEGGHHMIHRLEVWEEKIKDLKKQIRDIPEELRDAFVSWVLCEMEFEKVERLSQQKAAALSSVTEIPDIELEFNDENWEVSCPNGMPLAMKS